MKKNFILTMLMMALLFIVNAQDVGDVQFRLANSRQHTENAAPATNSQTRDGWMTWATTPDLNNGFGAGEAYQFKIAHRYTAEDLTSHVGEYITKVKFLPLGTTASYSVIIYKGGSLASMWNGNPGQIVYQQAVGSYTPNVENEVELAIAVPIEANNEYWIAINIDDAGGYPACIDQGPLVSGKGNLFYHPYYGWLTLDMIAEGYNVNWVISTYTESEAPELDPIVTVAPTALNWTMSNMVNPSVKEVQVSAYNTTDSITATITTPFEVSTDSVTFGPTATLDQNGGTLYVKMNTTEVGTYTGNMAITYTGLDTINIALTGQVFECEDAGALPLTESFENDIICWTTISANTVNPIILDSLYATDGDYSFRFASYNYAEDYNQYLITPELPTGVAKILSFDYKRSNNYAEYFKVGYSTTTNEINSFTWGPQIMVTVSDWQNYLNTNIPADAKYIALNYYSNCMYYLYIDNFNVTEAPSCMYPMNLVVGNITGHEATISWTPAESAEGTETYVVQYAEEGTEVWQQTTTTGNSVVLTELDPLTTYDVRLYMDCGDATSDTVTGTFTTIEACRIPSDLTIGQIRGTSALVSWTPDATFNGTQEFVITYTAAGGTPQTIRVTDDHRLISGLTPQTAYSVLLYMDCGEDGFSDTLSKNFTTNCLVGGDLAIGDGTTENSNFPSHSYYNYSFTQQLFLASEMNGAMEIQSLSLESSALVSERDIKMYLMHTSANSVSSWLETSGAQLVYTGTTSLTSGWNTFNLDSTFHYNGTDNIALIVIDETGSYLNGNYWMVHQAFTNCSRYIRTDGSPYSIYPVPISSGSADNVRNNVIFGSECDSTATCVAPNVVLENVGSSAITIAWVPGSTETSWEVQYKAAADAAWTSEGMITTSPYTVSNLNSNTEYTVRVGTVCGTETLWSVVSARTECAAFSLPFFEDFDNYTASSSTIPFCWTKPEGSTVYIASNQYLSGNNSLYMSAYDVATTIVLPEMDASVYMDSLLVTFDVYSYNTETIQIGVMTDPTDPSTFVMTDSYTVNNSNTWEFVELFTRNYAGEGRYVAIQIPDGISMYPYIDNVSISQIPSCFHVTGITTLNVTPTTATIGWTAGGEEMQWDYAYGLLGQVDTTDILTVYVDSVVLQNLSPVSPYEIWVRANCGEEYSAWETYTFRSGCAPITTLPYAENFDLYTANEDNVVKPACWTFPVTYYDYPYVSRLSYYPAYSQPNMLMFGSLTTTPTTAVLPPFNIDLHTLRLTFQVKAESPSYSGTLEVGVMSDPEDLTTFESVQIIQPNDNQWHEYEVNFNNTTLSGTGRYIAIRQNANDATSFYFIDDVVVDLLPSCVRPIAISVNASTESSVTLSWTPGGEEEAWNIVYGPVGFDPESDTATIVSASTNPYTIENLSNTITYDFYVQADCGSELSLLRGPVSALPGAIYMNTTGTDTVYMCSGHIFDDGGPTADYSNDCDAVLIVNPEVEGNVVTLQGTVSCEPYWDYLYIYDGAGTSGTLLATVTGQDIPVGPYTSTTGALTIEFTSDGGSTRAGFDLEVTCSEAQIATCDVPTALDVDEITQTGAVATWTAGGEETAWNLQYKEASATEWGSSINVTASTYTFAGLTANTAYQVRVQAVCAEDLTSDWTESFNFTTLEEEEEETCPAPTGLTSTDVQNETITLTWEQEANTADSWEVQYRVQGSETWNSATATAVPYTLTGLTGLTTYEIQVVANCTNGLTSDPSNMITETTTNVGISSYDLESSVSLYPNPTSDRVTISAQGMMESVSMYDVYGKLISTMKVNDTNATVDLSSYASGVYFARITTENGVVTKRIVKK